MGRTPQPRNVAPWNKTDAPFEMGRAIFRGKSAICGKNRHFCRPVVRFNPFWSQPANNAVPTARAWAKTAAPFLLKINLLKINSGDNGKQLRQRLDWVGHRL
jgi:hypothetical protein